MLFLTDLSLEITSLPEKNAVRKFVVPKMNTKCFPSYRCVR